jgi:hypothetical protein
MLNFESVVLESFTTSIGILANLGVHWWYNTSEPVVLESFAKSVWGFCIIYLSEWFLNLLPNHILSAKHTFPVVSKYLYSGYNSKT